jgi:hypothetical protein
MPLTLEDIAHLAIKYVRPLVRGGSTQVETNALPEIYQLALRSSIHDLRDEVNHVINSSADENKYEAKIETIKKYSLGNCGEMADLALYYVLTHHPSIYAQVYQLNRGDHVFLVIEKDAESFICDPWSNKVYPFSEWQDKLKAYKYTEENISQETKIIQENKLKKLQKSLQASNITFDTVNYQNCKLISIHNNEDKNIEIYYYNTTQNNYTVPLDDQEYLTPKRGYDSVLLYKQGITYRRAKIKEVLEALGPLQNIYSSQIDKLRSLLNQRQLLQDGCLHAALSEFELKTRKSMINQGLQALKRLEHDLHCLQWAKKNINLHKKFLSILQQSSKIELIYRIELFEKFYPLPEQLKKLNDAIDCLNQLVENRTACDGLANQSIRTSKVSESMVGTELKNNEELDVENYLYGRFIKGYQPIKIFSQVLDPYANCLRDLRTNHPNLYPAAYEQEINRLIPELKAIITEYLKLPTLDKHRAYHHTLRDVRRTLAGFNLPADDQLIISINKLINQLDNFEKGAPIRSPRKGKDSLSGNNPHYLFSTAKIVSSGGYGGLEPPTPAL